MEETFLESDGLMPQKLQETNDVCDEECERVDDLHIEMERSDSCCKEHRLVKKWYFVKSPM